MKNNELAQRMYSAQEISDILGISKVSVINKIKTGQIRAHKVGNGYVIDSADVLFGQNLPENIKFEIENVVKKAVKQYEEAFKLLSKE